MEPRKLNSPISRRSACLALAATPLWLVGCLTLPHKDKESAPAKEKDTSHASNKFEARGDGRMVVTFSSRVGLAADTERGGAQNPGLIGRIYMFAANSGNPFVTDGVLIVDLYDHTPRPGGDEPKLLEKWRFDETVLGKFAKRDFMGDGYSLFLPWGTYSTDVSQVLLQARFTSKDGKTALFNQTSIMTIDHTAVKDLNNAKKFGAETAGLKP